MYVADGLLNLPVEHASHGVRRLAAMESAAGSFEHARDMVREHTGLALGKRQVEGLTIRAAVDFDAFYAERVSAEPDPGEQRERERDGVWSSPPMGRDHDGAKRCGSDRRAAQRASRSSRTAYPRRGQRADG